MASRHLNLGLVNETHGVPPERGAQSLGVASREDVYLLFAATFAERHRAIDEGEEREVFPGADVTTCVEGVANLTH